MEDKGIIKNYLTAIDTFKLGYKVFRVYINFQDVTADIKNDIIRYFMKYHNIWVLASVRSPVNLAIVLWVNNVYKFDNFWDDILKN
jgi:hypothetical protein